MPSIGIIVALPAEARSLVRQRLWFDSVHEMADGHWLAVAGAGPEPARAAAAKLVDREVDGLVSWGCAAGLARHLAPGHLVMAEHVVGENGRQHFTDTHWRERLSSRLSPEVTRHVAPIRESRDVVTTRSNRYHFNGGLPADSTHWTTFSDAVTAAEKLIHVAAVSIVETFGYAAGSDVPIFSKTYALAGTCPAGGAGEMPGDVAALIRYSTPARTPKNHPVYLFNYYHGVQSQAAPNVDKLDTGQSTRMATYASAWLTGFSDGALTLVRAGPNGVTASGQLVEQYLTHRDFPR